MKRISLMGSLVLMLATGCPASEEDSKDAPKDTPAKQNPGDEPSEQKDCFLEGAVTTALTLGPECPTWQVRGPVFVDEGGHLVLTPGTTLQFENDTSLVIGAKGALTAEGTAESKILLTAAQKTPGAWAGVHIFNSNSIKNSLRHVTIEYGGGEAAAFSEKANLALSVNSTSTTTRISLDHVTLRQSAGYGLNLGGNSQVPVFTANTLTENVAGPANVWPTTARFLSADSSYVGNGKDRVHVEDSEITEESTWAALDVPWETGYLKVESDVHLTISPGAVLIFREAGGLTVEGSLQAEGTAEAPILFTGSEQIRGHWLGLLFANTGSTRNALKHAIVEYTGSARFNESLDPAAVSLGSTSPSRTCRVAIENTTLRHSLGYGLSLTWNAEVPNFVGNTLTGNQHGAAAVWLENAHQLLPASSYTGNDEGRDEVKLYADVGLSITSTWHDLGVPYRPEDEIVVGANGHLTLAPGVRIEFNNAAEFIVEDGRLTARGTADNRIVMTRSPLAGEDWAGLYLHNTASTDNILEFVDIRHGGAVEHLFGEAANLVLTVSSTSESSSITLRDVVLGDSAGLGIYVDENSSVSCDGVTFSNVAGDINVGSCQ